MDRLAEGGPPRECQYSGLAESLTKILVPASGRVIRAELYRYRLGVSSRPHSGGAVGGCSISCTTVNL